MLMAVGFALAMSAYVALLYRTGIAACAPGL
jgi:ABC-type amino acid transport system permease subunit